MHGQARQPHFSAHRLEIWKELSSHISSEDGWDGETITVRHGAFGVVLDVHAEIAGYSSRVETRFRAAYINRDGFRFHIKRHCWMTELATMLGAQDVETADEAFDKEFVLQSNGPAELRRLLASGTLRQTLLSSSVNVVEIRDDEGQFGPHFPGEVDELYMSVEGRLIDVEQLEQLYALFAELLDRLCQIGSAYEDDPEISL